MPKNVWIKYEFWKEVARDDPPRFTKSIPRFVRQVKAILNFF